MRVLVVAYACNPFQGSEEAVGWGWAHMIARDHEAHVITAEYHQPDIEAAHLTGRSDATNIKFYYVPARWWHFRPSCAWRRIEASALKPIMNLAYVGWQQGALRLARRLHEEHGFDLVHLVTYVGFRFPGRFWQLDIPFVWGPIGGLENTPWRLLPHMGLYGAIYYGIRTSINTLQKAALPGPRHAFKAAQGGVIAATQGIRREILRWYGVDCSVICEVGVTSPGTGRSARRAKGGPLRVVWSGQHLVGKALPLLLAALRRLGDSVQWHLTVLGDGPCRVRWQRMASRMGLSSQINWSGWLPRDEAMARMSTAHVFVLTSLKDLTSTVLLEALAHGLPVIALDHCGFADVVNETCGIKIPTDSPGRISCCLAQALARLAADEPLRRLLSAGARRRADEYSWDKKREMINRIYSAVCSGTQREVASS